MGPKCLIDPVVTPKIEFAEGKLSTTRTIRSRFSKEMLQDFTGFGTDDWKIDLSLYAALKHPISCLRKNRSWTKRKAQNSIQIYSGTQPYSTSKCLKK